MGAGDAGAAEGAFLRTGGGGPRHGMARAGDGTGSPRPPARICRGLVPRTARQPLSCAATRPGKSGGAELRDTCPVARCADPLAETMLAAAYTLAHDLETACFHADRALALDAGSAW